MKIAITFIFLICSLSAFCQTTEITIEVITSDSIFIVEKTVSAPTKENPRGRVTVDYHLKRGWADVANTIESVRRAARDEQAKVVKMNEAADAIENAANQAIQAQKATAKN